VESEKSHGPYSYGGASAERVSTHLRREALHYLVLRVRFGLLRINRTEGNVCSRNYYVLGTPNSVLSQNW
jgi:hypothetical protein